MNELNPKKSTENNPVFYLDGFEGETTKCLRSAGYASHDLFSANIFKDTAAALKVRIIIFSYFFPLFMLFPTFILFPTFSYIFLLYSHQNILIFIITSLHLFPVELPIFALYAHSTLYFGVHNFYVSFILFSYHLK